jgi:hypothetical protein
LQKYGIRGHDLPRRYYVVPIPRKRAHCSFLWQVIPLLDIIPQALDEFSIKKTISSLRIEGFELDGTADDYFCRSAAYFEATASSQSQRYGTLATSTTVTYLQTNNCGGMR